jgi:VIT1/CCC1 family predicted Fe2+/Mn2+ transporter
VRFWHNRCASDRANWINVVLGVWLIAAPFVLHYREWPFAAVSDMAVGVAVLFVGAVATRALMRSQVTGA